MKALIDIFGKNFIGIDELKKIKKEMNIDTPEVVPQIPPFIEEISLKINPDNYLLILSIPEFGNGNKINLVELRKRFGIDPDISEPCFYNQDWYLNENFILEPLPLKWNLLSKNIVDETRGVQPSGLADKNHFPKAILCAYTFFVTWFLRQDVLWKNDFVWCCDKDNKGDQIYVGSYYSNNNKNGFEIHRHLSIKKNYGALDNIIE